MSLLYYIGNLHICFKFIINAILQKYRDIKLLSCPRPPDKETIIKLGEEAMAEHSKSLGIDASHTPDKAWLISIISTFNP